MANPEHLLILKSGVKEWNQWRTRRPELKPDVSRAILSDTRPNRGLPRAPQADLDGVDFSCVDLTDSVLRGASLRDSNLHRANMDRVDLRRASLHRANATQAKVTHVNLTLADLSGADLTGATFWETVFSRVNLTRVRGLDSCRHGGPSVIDYNTIRTLQTGGGLPQVFLRGVGLPEAVIEYLPSLLNQPIQFYSCFISYSSKDQDFADRLHADLQSKGVRCWFAPRNIQGGRKIHEQIDDAIRVYDRLLLILSPASLDSEWVKTEIANSRQRERKEQRRMLFPIRLVDFERLRDWKCFDAETGNDSAREIREYYIPDFSNWKDHDSYRREFERLLRALKASSAVGPEPLE